MRWKQFFTPVQGIDAEALRAYLRAHREGTYTLLDVRQPTEYERGHIPGALLIPLPDLPSRMEEIDREKPVIAY